MKNFQLAVAFAAALLLVAAVSINAEQPAPSAHLERPDDPYAGPPTERHIGEKRSWQRGAHVSVQVNVADGGLNIIGDAANEPSIAVDPTDPSFIAIGWRQFDTILNNFRQAGLAYSTDGGASWTFPGVLDPGVFRSDPVLDFASDGTFYYNSLTPNGDLQCDLFTSTDGGATWSDPVYAYGHDKQWMSVDRTAGPGAGNIYQHWSPFTIGTFNRSIDGGMSFEGPVLLPERPYWGTTTVAPDGSVYVAGIASNSIGIAVVRSTNAQNPSNPPAFDQTVLVDLGGQVAANGLASPNPSGLLGQIWIAADHSGGDHHGNLYLLASLDPPGLDPLDVMFSRSTDGGATWSSPVIVNDDGPGSQAWQWFGAMSVAPDGRIDVTWNDTRNDPDGWYDSELMYAFSVDGGETWSNNEILSPPFNPHLGWPQQNKIGDYSDMVSNSSGVHIAYSATFNGEQDVYYIHLDPNNHVFSDGFETGNLTRWSASAP